MADFRVLRRHSCSSWHVLYDYVLCFMFYVFIAFFYVICLCFLSIFDVLHWLFGLLWLMPFMFYVFMFLFYCMLIIWIVWVIRIEIILLKELTTLVTPALN